MMCLIKPELLVGKEKPIFESRETTPKEVNIHDSDQTIDRATELARVLVAHSMNTSVPIIRVLSRQQIGHVDGSCEPHLHHRDRSWSCSRSGPSRA